MDILICRLIEQASLKNALPKHILEKLSHEGLNIFGSCLIANLPAEIQHDLTKAGIPLENFTSMSMLAHGGRTLWTRIPQPAIKEQHPIDKHTLRLLEEFGEKLILFPVEKWTIPLQRLGRFINLARPSLLGLDHNPEFGLWFAYRAVFLTKSALPETLLKDWDSPCNTCVDKPCMTASSPRLARIACPYKSDHQYTEEQMNYHY